MANPRAFISFDFDNDEIPKLLFAGQVKNSKTPFDAEDWSSKAALPQAEWEKQIKAKINMCNLMIILCGKNMNTAAGVNKEIQFANEANVPFFGVYVNDATTTSPLPSGLNRNRVISWEWNSIASAISQMMGEGKNK